VLLLCTSTLREIFVTIESSDGKLKGVAMTTEAHIEALERRHHELDVRIEDELSHPSHDDLYIAALKKKKLEIKDELQKLHAQAA
jgi:hypothetical protein